jgi:N-acetylglucosamine-6-phosphate deacetylase
MLHVRPAELYTSRRRLEGATLVVDGGRVLRIEEESGRAPHDADVIDATGLVCVPGFIDLQMNGGFGHDFTSAPESIWAAGRALGRFGVTGFLPTIITSPPEIVTRAKAAIAWPAPDAGYLGARVLGLHLEGPFLHPGALGAHDSRYALAPTKAAARGFVALERVRMVTLAPELEGAGEAMQWMAERGVVLAAGHSRATYVEGVAAIERGVRYATHLFNAMPPLHHREPGLAAALLRDDRVTVGVIADGVHVDFAMLDLAWRMLSPYRLNLVTDAMAAMGCAAGAYRLGDQDVHVDADSARLADGRLAGSILTLDRALRNLIAATGATLADVLPCVTSTPAALLAHECGTLEPGAPADFVLLTPALEVHSTYVGGRRIHPRDAD